MKLTSLPASARYNFDKSDPATYYYARQANAPCTLHDRKQQEHEWRNAGFPDQRRNENFRQNQTGN